MARIKALVVALMLSASSAALAQAPGVKLNVDAGLYIGATIGRSEARDFCSIGGACDPRDMSWNAFAGYRFNRYFALEAGYTDFGEATTSGFVTGIPTRVTAETTAFELVGVGRIPLGDSFSLYGKAGFFRFDSDGVATGGLVDRQSRKGTEFTFGFGAEYAFLPALTARVEWQRYLDIGSEVVGVQKADIGVMRIGAHYKF